MALRTFSVGLAFTLSLWFLFVEPNVPTQTILAAMVGWLELMHWYELYSNGVPVPDPAVPVLPDVPGDLSVPKTSMALCIRRPYNSAGAYGFPAAVHDSVMRKLVFDRMIKIIDAHSRHRNTHLFMQKPREYHKHYDPTDTSSHEDSTGHVISVCATSFRPMATVYVQPGDHWSHILADSLKATFKDWNAVANQFTDIFAEPWRVLSRENTRHLFASFSSF